MSKALWRFFLSPSDVGIEKYDLQEIAKSMNSDEPLRTDGLYSFAVTISELLDRPYPNLNNKYFLMPDKAESKDSGKKYLIHSAHRTQ